MIIYKVQLETEVVIKLDASNPNQYAEIQYEGEGSCLELLKEELPYAYGLFGHTIGSSTTPIDLETGLKNLPYPHVLVEGQEILDSYTPYKFPEGAVS